MYRRGSADQLHSLMKKDFKPTGYTSVSPYLIVNGAKRLADLLQNIFHAQPLRKYENPDGSIIHLEIKLDDSVIMISYGSEAYPAQPFLLHVYVPDVNATFKKAIDAGCEAVEEPVNKQGDPDTRGMFKDFNGNLWAVSTQL